MCGRVRCRRHVVAHHGSGREHSAVPSILKTVPAKRRRIVLVREILFAYGVLLVFFFLGNYLLRFLRLEQETLSIAGGIVLFLIALRMIFPREGGIAGDPLEGEPFLVPLAIPLFAGPSTLAALLLLQRSAPGDTTYRCSSPLQSLGLLAVRFC